MTRAVSRLLDPELVARLGRAQVRVRQTVGGTLSGIHRSPHHGSSVEFTEHKEYSPGDEVRHIDWRVYARTDRYYIKRYEDETNLRATFVLDCSGSMGYRGAQADSSKLDFAAKIVAHLAYVLLRQQDAVGLLAVAESVRAYLPPRAASAYLMELTAALEELAPAGTTALAEGLSHVADRGHRRGLVYVLSDLFVEPEPVFRLLRHLRSQKHQVTLFHVLDADELVFPFESLARFRAMETDARLLVEPRAIRGTYLAALDAFMGRVRRECEESGVAYQLVNTSLSLEDVLSAYLHGAAGAQQGRGGRGRRQGGRRAV